MNVKLVLIFFQTVIGLSFQEGPDYYTMAHTISEQITAQPGILIGGQLKEYQLKGSVYTS